MVDLWTSFGFVGEEDRYTSILNKCLGWWRKMFGDAADYETALNIASDFCMSWELLPTAHSDFLRVDCRYPSFPEGLEAPAPYAPALDVHYLQRMQRQTTACGLVTGWTAPGAEHNIVRSLYGIPDMQQYTYMAIAAGYLNYVDKVQGEYIRYAAQVPIVCLENNIRMASGYDRIAQKLSFTYSQLFTQNSRNGLGWYAQETQDWLSEVVHDRLRESNNVHFSFVLSANHAANLFQGDQVLWMSTCTVSRVHPVTVERFTGFRMCPVENKVSIVNGPLKMSPIDYDGVPGLHITGYDYEIVLENSVVEHTIRDYFAKENVFGKYELAQLCDFNGGSWTQMFVPMVFRAESSAVAHQFEYMGSVAYGDLEELVGLGYPALPPTTYFTLMGHQAHFVLTMDKNPYTVKTGSISPQLDVVLSGGMLPTGSYLRAQGTAYRPRRGTVHF
jgi:hypothetical protein